MGAGEAIVLILETLDTIWSLGSFLAGEEITQTTVYNFTGAVWLGYGYYTYYFEEGGSERREAYCQFLPNDMYDGMPIIQSEDFAVYAVRQNGSNAPTIGGSVTSLGLNGGTQYTFRGVVDDTDVFTGYTSVYMSNTNVSFSEASATQFKWTHSGSNVVQFFALNTPESNGKTILTTMSAYRGQDGRAPYVPSGQYTFDELREELINQYNNDFDLDIDVDSPEIPKLEDFLPEATGPGGSFVFDYNEVISPEELEEILQQETYDLDELETDMGIFDIVDVDESDVMLPDEYLENTGLALAAGWQLVQATGLSSTFICLGLIVAIVKTLRGS